MDRQALLRTIESLNLALFIDAQHERMLRRIEIETDDIDDFLGEVRIVRKLESLGAMRLQTIRFPHALHETVRHVQMLRERARAPVRSGMRSSTARCITLDAWQSRLGEAIAP